MDYEKGKASIQTTLDDDYNVPDAKPDVWKVILEKGEIVPDEESVTDGRVYLKAKLVFKVLYRTESEDHKIDCLGGEILFHENLVLEGATEGDSVVVNWEIEDLSVNLINSRKLNIKALISIDAAVHEIQDIQAASGIEDNDSLQKKYKEVDALQLKLSKRDTYRMKEEITLPSNKPNIREILWDTVQLRGLEFKLMENSISIKGEMLVFILYLPEEENEEVQWLETAVPYQGEISCTGCESNMLSDMRVQIMSREVTVKPDFDGEARLLYMDVVLELDMKLMEEEHISLLADVYATHCNVEIGTEKACFENLLIQNYSTCKVSERVGLEKEREAVLQICSSEGGLQIETVEQTETGLEVDGVLYVKILYLTADPKMPLQSGKYLLPFHQTVEVPGINQECTYKMNASIEQLSVSLVDNSEAEIRANIQICTHVYSHQMEDNLMTIEQVPFESGMFENLPGLIGYIVRENDDLWDLAKMNYTTIDEIKEVNHLTQDQLTKGEKILIMPRT